MYCFNRKCFWDCLKFLKKQFYKLIIVICYIICESLKNRYQDEQSPVKQINDAEIYIIGTANLLDIFRIPCCCQCCKSKENKAKEEKEEKTLYDDANKINKALGNCLIA